MKLENEQKHVIRELLKFHKPVTTLGGYAGTGKTTVIRHLADALPSFGVCAFTGKAADVLRKKGISRASTIHSLIYKPFKDVNGKVHFILTDDVGHEGFLVDEASMLSKVIFEDLKSFGRPIIAVGDHGQLEPVGDDFNLMQTPDYTLEKIHRNAGEIAHFAEYIRKGFRPGAWQYKSSGKKIKFINRREINNIVLDVDQIICAFNKTRVEINSTVRELLERPWDKPVVGDRVMCLRNNHKEGLFNGMQGHISELYGKNLMTFQTEFCDFDVKYDSKVFNQVKYDFDFEGPNPFDYCYCQTAHKSQGDEWGKGLVISQSCDLWNQVRWDYTAASRFKECIWWVA